MGKKVSRTEAAKILGCTNQTVANYAASGLIDETSRTSTSGKVSFFYDEDQLKKLAPDLTGLSTLRRRIAEEKAALEEELNALQDKKASVKEDRLLLSGELYRADSYRELIAHTWAFAFRAYPDLDKDRYRKLIEAIVEGKTLHEMAATLSITPERVRQILTKMGRHLIRRTNVEDILERYQKENWELEARVKVLTAQIEAMGADAVEVVPAATIPLRNCGLSARTLNLLHNQLGFSTLGEVTTLTAEQIRQTRNLGMMSYREILDALHRNGLELKEE